ncbi:PepSY-associated TM helix domain-containing protein [Methylobacterium planeticum]|uniref:PepSY domain-containing protein n=1 Tax=Methylobacterium planeticum TaxID=2615211 RepID=A0A6N6MLX1_9HYPH|nr:PepSY-associated TM helix domain-containing protein [Methylobacterium planeticum]KAB1072298.1 PepSY domain-containing protein [Methylobacterium planeticum]
MHPSLPTPRTLLFRLHWALGLTAGLVLALMGLTGALMSYEEAITAFANRDRAVVAVSDRPPLGPEALVARIEAQQPGLTVNALVLSGDPSASAFARFLRDPKTGARPAAVYVDPYDGTVLGPTRLDEAFTTVRALHRWLLIPGDGKGWGRTITGACALALLVFLATGLYLRWPRIHRWRIWLKPSLSRPGRPRWWSLHAVAGTWLLPVYLVIALSGLTWSYGWFKDGATWLLTGSAGKAGEMRPARGGGRKGAGDAAATNPGGPAIDRAWAAFQAGEGREAARSLLTLPGPDAKVIRIRWLARGAEQPKERNEATFDPVTGAPLVAERYADKPLGQRLADNMLEVHRGRFFGDLFALIFCLAALSMPGFAATGLVLYVLRRRAGRRRAAAITPRPLPVAGE